MSVSVSVFEFVFEGGSGFAACGSRVGRAWRIAALSQPGQPREHGAEPIEQGNHGLDIPVRSQAEQLNGFQGCRSFRRFPSGAAKPGETVGTRSARGLRYAQKGRKKCPPQLVCERGVPTGKTTGDDLALLQGLPRDREGIESVMIEGRNAPVLGWFSSRFRHSASRPRSRLPPSNTNSNTLTLTLALRLEM